MKQLREVIEIDEDLCDGCGQCVPACEEGAIEIIDGKAKLVSDTYCDGLGACLGECPADALKVVKREAEPFDEVAVATHLGASGAAESTVLPCGCPSMALSSTPAAACGCDEDGCSDGPVHSSLTHWPIQIRLVPPTAPFLQGAHILLAANCVPAAYPRFQQDLLRGKVVLLGCPKFDDVDLYEQRFVDIFTANDIVAVTAAVMEVPCCQGLPHIAQNAMRKAGKDIPMDLVTIGLQGEVLEEQALHH